MKNENTIDECPDARDYLGNYMRKEDIDGVTTVTLVDVCSEQVPGVARAKLVALFDEYEKPLILNATNLRMLCEYFGTSNTAQWRGELTLYVDPNVQFAGKPVGGLRFLRPEVITDYRKKNGADEAIAF